MVVVLPYNPAWPGAFAKEAASLRHALGDLIGALDHIGSTSVPGLAAKPIIDMLLEVPELGALDRGSRVVEALGYEVMGAYGIEGRRYFRKTDAQGVRTHQIHAFQSGSLRLLRHLAFRDYLRAHPVVAAEYGAHKVTLAAACANAQAYMDGKDAFVKLVEADALAWAARPA